MARSLGRAVRSVTIEPDDETLGRVRHYSAPIFFRDLEALANGVEVVWGGDGRTRRRIEEHIMICTAGTEAERRVSDDAEAVEFGAFEDFRRAVLLAECVTGGKPDVTGSYVDWLRFCARNLFRNRLWWAGVESLERELLKRPNLSGKRAHDAIQAGIEPRLRRQLPNRTISSRPS
jgi:hypothetical protein